MTRRGRFRWQTISSIVSDARVLLNLAIAPFRHAGTSHKARLEAFYQAQAGDYDVAATQAELQGIIDGSPVVMFSFTT